MKPDHVHIVDLIQKEFRGTPPARLGVAVSGGSDSVALLHALAQAVDRDETQLYAVTVDHGLRKAAVEEAQHVATVAAALDVPHDILHWEGWAGEGNLQAKARDARYRLMCAWAREKGIAVLAVGHTADDQAETVLMRLARASGVDGLAGIPRRRTLYGVTVIRPLLDVTRAALRRYLQDHGVTWRDDPSNDDPQFERVRMRGALRQLDDLGLDTRTLADVAKNMTRAREALDWYTFLAAREAVQLDDGDVLIDLRTFRTLPEEIARRLLIHALVWIGGGPYHPRREAVNDALSAVREGKAHTLHGCLILRHGNVIWICREYNAVREVVAPAGAIWDRRWRIGQDGERQDLTLRPLGKTGLSLCEDWRATGRPQAALTSSPSVWAEERLVAAPKAGFTGTVEIEPVCSGEEFFAAILSH